MQPRVDHIAFVVKDLERSVAFYRDVFGGEVGRSRGFDEKDKGAGRPVHTLVKVGDYGFDLFVQDPKDPPHPRARYLHFAFGIRPEEVDAALQQLQKLKIPFDGPKVHGGSTSISIYFADPDGYQLEFSAKFPDAESHKQAMERLGATYGGAGTKNYEWKADA